ncbi:mitogen-activated protein kinase kinase kinase 17-like [Momordica charantia]|uniref:Mitogen-activated protein kinase kinase kinase 17-like n=1 Tax=Momordica charantia TaxID=3673 RepID=A0A6J1BQ31_MOMCH|nr:mitogen-activated protein kinase kinase kinase 17-like [Momordica charantia]
MAPIRSFKEYDLSAFDWDKTPVLGKGSHGKVFLGELDLGSVAIKVAPCRAASSLVKEKAILKQFIGCSKIVQYIGDTVTKKGDDVVYSLILEYATGGTLGDIIRKQEKISEEDAKKYLRMILQGLSCIHAKGFVHADLKSDNILAFRSKSGRMKLKIADFGLSRMYDEKEEKSLCWNYYKMSFVGTAKYMSPESVFDIVKPALDIWSLGCIFVNMMTGRHVWNDCKDNKELISKLIYEREIPTIPKELSELGKDFLEKCFERNYEKRWSADMLLRHPYLGP